SGVLVPFILFQQVRHVDIHITQPYPAIVMIEHYLALDLIGSVTWRWDKTLWSFFDKLIAVPNLESSDFDDRHFFFCLSFRLSLGVRKQSVIWERIHIFSYVRFLNTVQILLIFLIEWNRFIRLRAETYVIS